MVSPMQAWRKKWHVSLLRMDLMSFLNKPGAEVDRKMLRGCTENSVIFDICNFGIDSVNRSQV
jgi:hypothetical protein